MQVKCLRMELVERTMMIDNEGEDLSNDTELDESGEDDHDML